MTDQRLPLWSAVCTLMLLTSGCVTHQTEPQNTIAEMSYHSLKQPTKEPLIVTSEDVVKRYQAYLQVAPDDQKYLLIASQRVAALSLNSQIAMMESDFVSEEEKQISPAELAESIRSLEANLADQQFGEGSDQILYQLAKAYSIAAQPEDTVRVLDSLVEHYPDSAYYLDAQFRLGELRYVMGDYTAAETAFGAIQAYGKPGNKYYNDAVYKKGWSVFKQSRYDDSLDIFANLLDEMFPTAASIDVASSGDLAILKDSLYNMAVTFSFRGEWEEIGDFFDRHGHRHYEYLVYQRLAEVYVEQKYYQSAASTLSAFVARYPDDDRAPAAMQQMITLYNDANYPVLKRQYEGEYIDRFGIDTPYWLAHSDEVRETIKEPLASYLLDLAKFNHGWAQQAKNDSEKAERYAQAAKWYEIYIRSVPDAADIAEAHFLLAEIAYEIGNYPLARDHYEIVAYQYPDYEKAAEAGYATVLTYGKYKPTDEQQAYEWRQQGAENAMRFVRAFPDHEKRGQVLVATAELFLEDDNYEEALAVSRMAWEIRDSLSAQHRYGAALVRGHASYELGNYQEAEESLREALKYNKIDRKTRKDLREKVAAAIYKQGEQAREQGNYELAASNWNRIGDVTPGSENSVVAEFDAATLLLEVKKYDEAEQAYLTLQKKYPDNKLSKDIPQKLVYIYEQQEKWGPAAKILTNVWRTSTDVKQQRIACFQAAEYYEKAGDPESAIIMYRRYANSYEKPFDPLVEAHAKLEQLYAAEGTEEAMGKRLYWLKKVIQLNNDAGAKATPRSRFLAAGATYELAEMARTDYEKIPLSLPLNKSIPKKNKALEKAQQMYTDTVQSGVQEYTTASTYRIGQLYTQLSKALLNSERPAGMDDLELEEYQFLLEDQAYPFEQAAMDIQMKNINRTYDGIYDEWVKKSFEVMSELKPTQYRKEEKAPGYVSQIR
ncbi:tetratricopeptide repeat protein [Oceanobacter mangrovi]|uniref:tetratricopeptide repeat protein n=1 Tax=Oceanobacter mangrovi TaxID=2862510 RepID=UPI001C8D22CF|nr:tetratricopeptide repeat protein [Oceanobacter mangrovi]